MPRQISRDSHPVEAIVSDDDVINYMRRHYAALTDLQKRIAEYVIDQPQVVAFSTVDQMAAFLRVDPSTIVRFAYRLGLGGFPDLQERMREVVRGQLSRTGDPIQDAEGLKDTSFGASLRQDRENLHRTIASLDANALGRAVDLLCNARQVYVVGGFSAYPVAQYCALALSSLHRNVLLVASHDALASSVVAHMTQEDCVLAFTFSPYAAATHSIIVWAKENGTKVIAVTDSPLSAVGKLSDAVVIAAMAGKEAHSSMVAPLAIANALLTGISAFKGAPAWDLQEPSASEADDVEEVDGPPITHG